MNDDGYYAQATKRNIGLVTREEQERLRTSRVAIAGMGGAGGGYVTTCVRMGIGGLSLADFDRFSVANVNRQQGAMSSTIDRPKAEVMAEIARDIHPDVDVRVFNNGIHPGNIDDFLKDANAVLDALDVFAMPARRLLYRRARELGIPVLFGAPPGFSASIGVVMPDGMSFDEYFDIRDGMSDFEQLIAFAVAMAPPGTHWRYMDSGRVDSSEQAAPSMASALTLTAGWIGTELLVVLLKRREPLTVPRYMQFDPYLQVLRKGRLLWGNRGPVQRFKRWAIAKKFAAEKERVVFTKLPTA